MEKDLSLPSLADVGNIPDRVHQTLEAAILQGKFKQGMRLIEGELAGMLGVSRAPVREALLMLREDGLVVISPRKGAVVNSISREDIAEIYEVAGVLELLAVKLFCERATDDEFGKLRNLYEEMEAQVRNNNPLQYRKFNREFHETLVNGSKNKMLGDIYRRSQKHISLFQNVTMSLLGKMGILLQEHKDILEALQKKDSTVAGNVASEHIKRTAEIYLNAVSQVA